MGFWITLPLWMEWYKMLFQDRHRRTFCIRITTITTPNQLDTPQNAAFTAPYDPRYICHKWPATYSQMWPMAGSEHTPENIGYKPDSLHWSYPAADSGTSHWTYSALCQNLPVLNTSCDNNTLTFQAHTSCASFENKRNAYCVYFLQLLVSTIRDTHLLIEWQWHKIRKIYDLNGLILDWSISQMLHTIPKRKGRA